MAGTAGARPVGAGRTRAARRPARLRLGCAAAALLLGLSPSFAAHARNGLPDPVVAALERAKIPLTSVAVVVQEVARPQPLLAWQETQPMTPASVMKVLTTFAALDRLGPAYQWHTKVHVSGLQGDVVNGDLTLEGAGDPTLSVERFGSMLSDLRARGIREIRGDLVLDESWLEAPAPDAAPFDEKPERAYNVRPQGLLVGLKMTLFRFAPDPSRTSVRILAIPDLPEISVVNAVEPRPGACPDDWSAGLERVVTSTEVGVTVRFSGTYPVECGDHDLALNLLDNPRYVYSLFRRLWAERGGIGPRGVRRGPAPEGSVRVLDLPSMSLAEAVHDTNKVSSNVMARQILLTLGAERFGLPTSETRGARAVREWLSGRDLDFPELRIENGSGLSRLERISAQHLASLLVAAARSPLMPEFVASLPLAAVDGTMKRRLRGRPVAGQAHVKTGQIDGVRTIAGYVLDRGGRWMVVVFLVNHPDAAAAGAAQDALLEWVHARQNGS